MVLSSMETWKTIPGYSRYEASTLGRLRSLNYKNSGKTVILKPAIDYGYLKTMLQKDDGGYGTIRVHKCVALAYLGAFNYPAVEVNHIDGDKLNNAADNLEYCTHAQNVQHSFDNGLQIPLRGVDIATSKLNEEQVLEIRQYARKHGKLKNRKLLAAQYGVCESTLKDIVSMRRGSWSHV